MKPKLSLCEIDIKNPWRTLGMTELLKYLENSGEFDVTYHNEKLPSCRSERATTIYYNNKKIYLDLWDYEAPTHTDEVFKGNFDLIIKLQKKHIDDSKIEEECVKKDKYLNFTKEERFDFFKKIVPWTFFPSKMLKKFIGSEDKIETKPIERLAFFCGKDWRCRRFIKQRLISENIPYLTSDQETNTLPLKEDQYLDWMMTSKYGLVIHGRGGWMAEGKNRREIDYMMLKKPLLLNYKPNYYNPLIEGKHYIYIDTNTSFKNIETMYNIDEIARNGYQWYKDNASPEGVVKTFLQIMNDKKF
jgi:hypothetical protein